MVRVSEQPITDAATAALVAAQRAYNDASARVRAWHFAHPELPAHWSVADNHRHDDLHAAEQSALIRLHILRAEHHATGYDAVRMIEKLAAEE